MFKKRKKSLIYFFFTIKNEFIANLVTINIINLIMWVLSAMEDANTILIYFTVLTRNY